MDPRYSPGFLGTNASLLADLNLIAYILLIVPGMVLGFAFARRGKYAPQHKLTMTTVVIINWLLIIFVMSVSYRLGVVPKIHDKFSEPSFPFNAFPTVHLIFGGLAQIIGTVLVLRMWLENVLPKALLFYPFKPWMRLTLGLWMLTATLGVSTYIAWYGVPFFASPSPTTPGGVVKTEEATKPGVVKTEQATKPATSAATGAATSSVVQTEQATKPAPAAVTGAATSSVIKTEKATN